MLHRWKFSSIYITVYNKCRYYTILVFYVYKYDVHSSRLDLISRLKLFFGTDCNIVDSWFDARTIILLLFCNNKRNISYGNMLLHIGTKAIISLRTYHAPPMPFIFIRIIRVWVPTSWLIVYWSNLDSVHTVVLYYSEMCIYIIYMCV